jgi:glycerophosphoryl diester phosphodiesterase
MRRLLDMGVDGIMTDRTDLLKAVLQERDAWVVP